MVARRLELLWTEVLTRADITDPADPAGQFRQVAVDGRRVGADFPCRGIDFLDLPIPGT